MGSKSAKYQLILSMAIFGTIGIVRKFIPLSSGVIAVARGFIGMLFLFVLCFFKGERMNWKAIGRNGKFLIPSGMLIGLNWVCLFEAYRYTSVATATICYYMAPVFVILVSPVVLHERLTLQKGICAAVALMGMALVSNVTGAQLTGMRGILYGLAAAAMYASVIVMNKFVSGVSANERTIVQLGLAAAAAVPYVLLTEDLSQLQLTFVPILFLLVAGIVHTGIAYALYFGSIRTLPAQTIALYSYLDPVIAVILSVIVLRESMTALNLAGVILVIGAAAASDLLPSPKKEMRR